MTAEPAPEQTERSWSVHAAPTAHLDAATLYRILALRTDVFVVEQQCPYPELDGRDLEPTTVQVWAARGREVLATLRVLRQDDGSARIGRVATAATARGQGIAAQLMREALVLTGGSDVELDAQSYLEGWYTRFGFVRSGAEFVEDGIPHVPMRRAAQPGERPADPRRGWLQAARERRGGDTFAALVAAQRLVQDRVSTAAPPDGVLTEVTARLTDVAELLEPHVVPEQQRFAGVRPELPGRGSPLLPPFEVDEWDASSVRGRVRFTSFYLGAGAAVHGGAHTLLFDDVLGFLAGRAGGPCRTAALTVNYRRITPVGVELTFDGTLDSVDGRKRTVSGRLRDPAGQLVADANGLFLALRVGQQ